MNCDEALRRVDRYLGGEEEEHDDPDELEGHLGDCASCRERFGAALDAIERREIDAVARPRIERTELAALAAVHRDDAASLTAGRVEDAPAGRAGERGAPRGVRSLGRVVTLGVGVIIMAAASLMLVLRPGTPRGAPPARQGGAVQVATLRWSDGSEASASVDGQMSVAQDTPTAVTVVLSRGIGRFRVAHNPRRLFEVRSADVVVRVLGTEFEVERRGARTAVRVQQGAVSVTCGTGAIHLGAGQSHEVDCAAAPVPAAPEVLLRVADEARAGGHPGDAVAPLEEFVRRYPQDARAAAAAYTLGRVLSDDLRRPIDAARAFALTRELAPGGPLARGAAEREQECLRAAALARGDASAP